MLGLTFGARPVAVGGPPEDRGGREGEGEAVVVSPLLRSLPCLSLTCRDGADGPKAGEQAGKGGGRREAGERPRGREGVAAVGGLWCGTDGRTNEQSEHRRRTEERGRRMGDGMTDGGNEYRS